MKKEILDKLDLLMNQERWGELAGLASKVLEGDNSETSVLLYMAVGHFHTGNLALAQKEFNEFCLSNPSHELGLFHLARCYEKTNLPFLADNIYAKLCTLFPSEIKYFIYKCVNLYNNKMYEEIRNCIPDYIRKWPDVEVFSLILIEAYEREENKDILDPTKILNLFSNKSLHEKSDEEKLKLINIFAKNGRVEEIDKIIEAITEDQAYIKIFAEARKKQCSGKLDEAIALYKKSIEIKAVEQNVLALISTIFYEKKDHKQALKEAEKFFYKSLGLNFTTGLSFLYLNTPGQVKKAISLITRELKNHHNNTDLLKNLAFSYLAEGNLKLGWKYYESRESTGFKRNVESYRWDGSNLKQKRIMLYSEQGVGDHILFGSVLPDFEKKSGAEKIIFETDPRIVSLMQRSLPNIDVRPLPRTKSAKFYLHDYDCYFPLGDLLGLYRKRISDFPGTPFLKTDPKVDLKIKNFLSESTAKIKVGIIWTSRLRDTIRNRNYLTVEETFPLFSSFNEKEIEWINLQYGDVDQELSLIAEKTGVLLKTWDINLKDDFESVASLIKHLDLVITAGTAIHALAGALGTRTWMFAPNPLWTTFKQNYYPWFNTVRLYQPPSPAPMQLSIPYIIEDLEKWLKTGEAPPHRSQVLIDRKEAEEKLEKCLALHEQKIQNQFLSEKNSEESLSEGISHRFILQKTASIRLKKRLEKINEDQFFNQTTIGSLDNFSQENIKLREEFLFKEKVTESKNIVLIFTGNDQKTLPLNNVVPYALQEFNGDEIINQLGEKSCSFLQIRDGWQMWYQVGPLGSCLLHPEKAADKWLELITPKIEQSKAEKIICVGTSAGASAAIQFGAKLNADAVVAISPQARPLDGEWELENGGFSFLEEGGNWRKQVRDKFNLSPVDLKPYADELGDKLHIIVPKLNKIDITHADYLTQDNPNVQRYRSTGKNHGEVNNELILDIIKKLI